MSKIPYGIIYMTSRVLRGEVVKRYIGQHKLMHNQRDDYYIGSGLLLSRAIRKYGRGAFVRETLETCYSAKELNEAEEKWIDSYDAVNNPLFYNVEKGGTATIEKFRKEVFQYSIEGHFIAHYVSRAAAEMALGVTIGIIGQSVDNLSSTAAGFRWMSHKVDKLPPLINKRFCPIKCFTLEGVFVKEFPNNVEAAASVAGVNKSNILACCKGRYKSSGGFQWRYANDPSPVTAYCPSNNVRRVTP